MSKPLTEQKVLKKLDIEDFSHLTKDKVITISSMFDKMDPEVAKKALEQFPEFAATTKEILVKYKETLEKGLESNKESVQAYYDSCNSIIASLQKQLENENISVDEKRDIIDKMLEVSKMIGEKDSENKKFILALALIGGAVVTVVGTTLASALGGSVQIETNDII